MSIGPASAAHDFASALGAPHVLMTRARRDERSPTVASRFWLRLQAMTGGVTRDTRLERLLPRWTTPASAAEPLAGPRHAARGRSAAANLGDLGRPPQGRSVAFYAQAMLGLRSLDPVDADHSAEVEGHRRPQGARRLAQGGRLRSREAAAARPRRCSMARQSTRCCAPCGRRGCIEAIKWIARAESKTIGRRAAVRSRRKSAERPRSPASSSTARPTGSTCWPTAASQSSITRRARRRRRRRCAEGFALQLGLLGLIARAGGFPGVSWRT